MFNNQEYVIGITVEGGSNGIKILELGKVICLACPRAFFDAHKSNHDEFTHGGVYILAREKDGKQTINIGETKDFISRFKTKPDWAGVELVIVFTGNNPNDRIEGVSAHLESYLLEMAKERNYVVENPNASHPRTLSRPEKIKYKEYLGAIMALWPHLGLDTPARMPAPAVAEKPAESEPVAPPSPAPTTSPVVYECEIAHTEHKAYLRLIKHTNASPSFVVQKGSIARKEETASIYAYQRRERDKLKASGVLKEEGDHLVFTKDHSFSSSTMAASVVMGRSANGYTAWKTPAGEELREALVEDSEQAE